MALIKVIEASNTKEVQFIQEANRLSLKPDFLALVTVSNATILHRLNVAKENRVKLDQYETYEKITKRKDDYFKYSQYIDLVMSNDNETFLENNVKKIISIVNEK